MGNAERESACGGVHLRFVTRCLVRALRVLYCVNAELGTDSKRVTDFRGKVDK